MRLVSEFEFRVALMMALEHHRGYVSCVSGPGRSGAIASVYASHMLGIPWIPGDVQTPLHLLPCLVVDTARLTGATLRRAVRRAGEHARGLAIFQEPPRVRFWYEMW